MTTFICGMGNSQFENEKLRLENCLQLKKKKKKEKKVLINQNYF
jgi:hypothetical protein